MASTMFYHGCHHAHEDFHHQQSHFLEACSGCQKPLGHNRDIFMYRGITAYCSNECRQEQIEMDEAEERSWKRRALRNAASNKAPAAADSKSAVRVS